MLGISASYLDDVAEKEPEEDRHVLPRTVISVDGDDWKVFARRAGRGKRPEILRQFVAWYIRKPGAKLPERPPRD